MLTQMKVREYAAQLADRQPTPGGGSATALVGALGAALGEMVANFTAGKEGWEEIQPALAALTECRQALLDLTDRDAEAYAQVGAAYRLPKDSEEQKTTRAAAIQEALKQSARVPLAAIEQLALAVSQLPDILQHGNPNLVSDVGVAADFSQAALRCAWLNVEVNLALVKDEDYKTKVRALMKEKMTAAAKTAAEVWEETVNRVTR